MCPINRRETTPFMLQVFYRTGAFHRPDEFAADPLPPHLTIHTWSDCSLSELSHHIAIASQGSCLVPSQPPNQSPVSLLPKPAIGTRLAFRLIFADTRHSEGASRFVTKELGSVVIGNPETKSIRPEGDEAKKEGDVEHEEEEQGAGGHEKTKKSVDGISNERDADNDLDANLTLASARFVVGDYISCAILPPSASDGSIAEPGSARTGRGQGVGEAKFAVGRSFHHASSSIPSNYPGDGRGSQMMSLSTTAPSGPRGRGGRDPFRGEELRGGGMPRGDWKRGEELPSLRARERLNGGNDSDNRRWRDRQDPAPSLGPYGRRRGGGGGRW